MKLITKTILYFILISIPLLLAVGIIGFIGINEVVNENVNENLWNEKQKAEKVIDGFVTPQNLSLSFDSSATIQIDSTKGVGYQFLERIRMNNEEGEQVKYKTLKSYYNKGSTNYLITITRPAVEEDDLVENLVGILLLILGTLVLAFLLVNFFISRQIWKPFYKTLENLAQFELSSNKVVVTGESTISEFKKLNDTLTQLTTKMQKDFSLQKEFTENASHEMQTPLAVIKAKIEQLMQSQHLKEEEMTILQSIETSLNKLSSLNKSLLHLAKIENHQYKEVKEINVYSGIQHVLKAWEDFINEKAITVTMSGDETAVVKMHPALFDSLITNLIQNAVRHNFQSGKIRIEVAKAYFSVSNSGAPLAINSDELFQRFKKGDATKESTGLGLAIVKSIADTYNFKIDYMFAENMHTFKINY